MSNGLHESIKKNLIYMKTLINAKTIIYDIFQATSLCDDLLT